MESIVVAAVKNRATQQLGENGVEDDGTVVDVTIRRMESIVVAAVKNRATQQLGENCVEDDDTVVDVRIMESIVVAAEKNRATQQLGENGVKDNGTIPLRTPHKSHLKNIEREDERNEKGGIGINNESSLQL